MITIKDLIKQLKEEGLNGADIARVLEVSVPMVSTYTTQHYLPSISVAKRVYIKRGIVLHPFSEESIEYEIGNSKKTTPPLPGMKG